MVKPLVGEQLLNQESNFL